MQLFWRLKKDGYSWSDMAVVYRSKFMEDDIQVAFEDAGIPLEMLTSRTRHPPGPHRDAVSLVTFHSSKGLEYAVVAIPGFGFLPNERESEADEVRLAYVAMTRATERLVVTCHRESAFTKRLLAAGARPIS